jgi:hypothetical protein
MNDAVVFDEMGNHRRFDLFICRPPVMQPRYLEFKWFNERTIDGTTYVGYWHCTGNVFHEIEQSVKSWHQKPNSIPRVRALRFPFSSRNIKREALTIKPGPTESGEVATTSRPPPTPVGGEMLPVDKLGVFLSQYWLLIIILMVPLMLLLYVKRNAALKLLSPILPKLLRLR